MSVQQVETWLRADTFIAMNTVVTVGGEFEICEATNGDGAIGVTSKGMQQGEEECYCIVRSGRAKAVAYEPIAKGDYLSAGPVGTVMRTAKPSLFNFARALTAGDKGDLIEILI